MAVQFTQETKAALHMAANALAGDILEQCVDNEEFIEVLLDSDYITVYGSLGASCEIASLCREHGYDEVLKAVCALHQYK